MSESEAELDKESDRAAVIIMASLLETNLDLHLQNMMVFEEEPFREEDLFGLEKPIGSFSAKIKLAFALKLLDLPTARQFEILRVARNQCAHSQNPLTFETPELRNFCLRLFQPENDPFHPDQGELSFRKWFMKECAWIGIAVATGSRANARRYFAVRQLQKMVQAQIAQDELPTETGESDV